MSIQVRMHTINPLQFAAYSQERRIFEPGEILVVLDEINRPAEMVFGNGTELDKCVILHVKSWDEAAAALDAVLDAIEALEDSQDAQDFILANHEGRLVLLESGSAPGDVLGPAGGVVDNEIVVFSGTGGKTIKSSGGKTVAALEAATAAVASDLATHAGLTDNPHAVTKSQVGLANVDNTSDANKPVSTAQQTALDGKQNINTLLTAIAGLASNGIIVRTSASAAVARSIAVTASTGLGITNGDGVSGNPTLNGVDATTSAKGVGEIATGAEFITGTDTARLLGVAETWAAAALAVLTDGANIAVNMASGINHGAASNAVLLLGGNRALSAPTNAKNGQSGTMWFGATGATRTLTLNAAYNVSTNAEAGPYSITTSQVIGIHYLVRGTTVYVTGVTRV